MEVTTYNSVHLLNGCQEGFLAETVECNFTKKIGKECQSWTRLLLCLTARRSRISMPSFSHSSSKSFNVHR